MGLSAKLRTKLASRRGVTAAAGAAVVLFIGSGSAAAAGGARWTKAWTEHEIREHFGAATVICLPLGRATRPHGSKAFTEFVCAFVTADGSRYTIHLKPRTSTTWTTLSIKKVGKAAGAGAGGSGGGGHGGRRGGAGGETNGGGAPKHA